MMASLTETPGTMGWQPVSVSEHIAVAELDALGTRVRVAVWPSDSLEAVTEVVGDELRRLDEQASRFRKDSELSRMHAQGGGLYFISRGLAGVIDVALAAACWTNGLVDPTIGNALIRLGYDRDFSTLPEDACAAAAEPWPAPGYWLIELSGRLLRLPSGILLDLGATAKGLGADRAAVSALAACGDPGGVLVSLGGDIAVAGEPPLGGWPLVVGESAGSADASQSPIIRLPAGGIATSSTTVRQWRQAGQAVHHIIDPRTGLPASGPWHTVSVAAASCAEANAASTAAIVAGEHAVSWLENTGLPSRLISADGAIRCLGAWPDTDGGLVRVPAPRMGHPMHTAPERMS
jgi:thiamine biosynthesis lipoprotein